MAGKHTFPEVLWAGTEHSLTLAVEAHNRIMAGPFDRPDEEEDDLPHNVTIQGEVAIVSIKGSLTNRDSWINRYYGMTSYADIRRAMLYVSQKADVKAILLDIDSGGGAVNGVADAGNLIRTVDKNIKPVYAFTDGTMCSAAYWIGCSARKVYSSNVSTVGSIGVIATHMEYSKQLKDEGIGVNVIRAGEFKALLNSVEPATKEALAQLQSQLNAAYSVFIEYVADCRGVTVDSCDKTMAQGREFFGEQALAAGLVDGIESFDAAMSKILVSLLDNRNNSNNNSVNYQRGMNMSKQALTEQQIAAIASGANIQAGIAAPVEPEIPNGNGAAAEPAAGTEQQAADAGKPEALAQNENEKDSGASVVAFLQSQIKDKDAALLDQAVAMKGLTDKIASMEANYNGLLAIAQVAVSNMKVALNHAGTDVSKMSAEALLAEHASLTESFKKSFKAGGVAAVDAASNESEKAAVDPLHSARIAATRF